MDPETFRGGVLSISRTSPYRHLVVTLFDMMLGKYTRCYLIWHSSRPPMVSFPRQVPDGGGGAHHHERPVLFAGGMDHGKRMATLEASVSRD